MLELNIIDGIRPDNPTLRRKAFNMSGGSIGRDAQCTWVLQDRQRVISGEHAKIIFSQGAYYLSDVSTNGVLNQNGQSIGKGELRKLNRGDIYIIGPYRIEVAAIKLSDLNHSFKEAGLQHLLSEPKDEALTPLNYAQQSELSEEDFAFELNHKKAPNTLKAYDFMPEPLDLVIKSSNDKIINPCIPEDAFQNFNNAKPVQSAIITEAVTAPISVSTEAQPNLPVAVSGINFLQEICQAFNLDPRLLGTQTMSELHQKIIDMVQGVLAMLLELRALDKHLNEIFAYKNKPVNELHNPLHIAVSQRQLLELFMREDPEFMNAQAALLDMRESLVPKLHKLLANIFESERTLLHSLAPDVIAPKSSGKFNFLAEKHAWQAYQHQYQQLSQDNCKLWLDQFITLIKEK